MKYHLIISDFDGTLGNNSEIDGETVETIKKFIARGGKFVVCTGRHYLFIKPICVKYGLTGLVSTCQGARIRDIDSGKMIVDGGIKVEDAYKFALENERQGIKLSAYIDEVLYCNKNTDYQKLYSSKKEVPVIEVDSIAETIYKKNYTVQKFVLETGGIPYLDFMKKTTLSFPDLIFNTSGGETSCFIEVINKDFSKGNAVRKIAEYYGIPLSKVMAVGDSLNDKELIEGEWHGVAVGNSPKSLISVAKEKTVKFEDKPIKTLIEKYCL